MTPEGHLFTTSDSPFESIDVPTLVVALQQEPAAAHAAELVTKQFEQTLEHERIATFDLDALMDLRTRRPAMTMENYIWSDYDAPEITLDRFHDDNREAFLMLSGTEPDLRWKKIASDVTFLARMFDVKLVISLAAFTAAVPHTRPTVFVTRGTLPEDTSDNSVIPPNLQAPGSLSALIEMEMNRNDIPTVGFTALVPYYVAGNEYPSAATALVRKLADRAGLSLPVGDLESAARSVATEIESQVTGNKEVETTVERLEEMYDQDIAADTVSEEPTERDVPDADEIGAELEAFLQIQRTSEEEAETRQKEPRGENLMGLFYKKKERNVRDLMAAMNERNLADDQEVPPAETDEDESSSSEKTNDDAESDDEGRNRADNDENEG